MMLCTGWSFSKKRNAAAWSRCITRMVATMSEVLPASVISVSFWRISACSVRGSVSTHLSHSCPCLLFSPVYLPHIGQHRGKKILRNIAIVLFPISVQRYNKYLEYTREKCILHIFCCQYRSHYVRMSDVTVRCVDGAKKQAMQKRRQAETRLSSQYRKYRCAKVSQA